MSQDRATDQAYKEVITSIDGMTSNPKMQKKIGYKNLSASDYYTNGKIYSYDFLTAQKDMVKVKLPDTGFLADKKGKIDDEKVLAEGIKNAHSEGTERGGKVYVKNAYTGRELRIDNSTIKHGLDGTYNRHLTNARIGSVIGSVVKNAIPINGLKNTSDKAVGTYAMVSYCYDSLNRQFIAVVTVEQQTGNVDSFELYDVAHAVSGRQKKGSQVDTKSQGVYPIKATTVSIADLLQIVNSTHKGILSEDVLAHFGETEKLKGGYADKVLFQDRTPYQSARDILVSYAEDAKNVKARTEYLDEYVERVKRLDLKNRRYEDAVSNLATAVDSGNKEKIAIYQKRVENLEKTINQMHADLQAMEDSKELKAIVRREKAETKRQTKREGLEKLQEYRDSQERRSRIDRIEAKVSLLGKKILANNRELHIPDALKEPIADFITVLDYEAYFIITFNYRNRTYCNR